MRIKVSSEPREDKDLEILWFLMYQEIPFDYEDGEFQFLLDFGEDFWDTPEPIEDPI
jgi:hypothetical protein